MKLASIDTQIFQLLGYQTWQECWKLAIDTTTLQPLPYLTRMLMKLAIDTQTFQLLPDWTRMLMEFGYRYSNISATILDKEYDVKLVIDSQTLQLSYQIWQGWWWSWSSILKHFSYHIWKGERWSYSSILKYYRYNQFQCKSFLFLNNNHSFRSSKLNSKIIFTLAGYDADI